MDLIRPKNQSRLENLHGRDNADNVRLREDGDGCSTSCELLH